jgi:hypothetical protein
MPREARSEIWIPDYCFRRPPPRAGAIGLATKRRLNASSRRRGVSRLRVSTTRSGTVGASLVFTAEQQPADAQGSGVSKTLSFRTAPLGAAGWLFGSARAAPRGDRVPDRPGHSTKACESPWPDWILGTCRRVYRRSPSTSALVNSLTRRCLQRICRDAAARRRLGRGPRWS